MQSNSQIVPSLSDYHASTCNFRRLRQPKTPGQILVSVITVVKNDDSNLKVTINSVKNQDYKNIEHIVINGGKPVEVDADILILTEADRGIADAFNKGIAVAEGEIICLLNAGDTYTAQAISSIVKLFQTNSKIQIICASALVEDSAETFYRKSDDSDLEYYMSVVHPATFVRKQVYQELGLFKLNYSIAMDYEFLLRAKKLKYHFLSIDEVVVKFAVGGISERKWFRGFLESFKARKLHLGRALYVQDLYSIIFHLTYMFFYRAKLFFIIKYYRKFFSKLSYLKNE